MRAWCPSIAVAVLLLAPALVRGQSVDYGVRAGVVMSTALAEDRVAGPRLAAALGGVGPVRAVVAPALQIEASAGLPMRRRTRLDLAVGWSFLSLEAEDDSGVHDLQDVGAGHATISVRWLATSSLAAGCGVGVIRYFSEKRALFSGGTEISPLLECATRVSRAAWSGGRVFVRVAGQAHRFRTPALIDAGAQAGSVFRLAVQAGVELGGSR